MESILFTWWQMPYYSFCNIDNYMEGGPNILKEVDFINVGKYVNMAMNYMEGTYFVFI